MPRPGRAYGDDAAREDVRCRGPGPVRHALHAAGRRRAGGRGRRVAVRHRDGHGGALREQRRGVLDQVRFVPVTRQVLPRASRSRVAQRDRRRCGQVQTTHRPDVERAHRLLRAVLRARVLVRKGRQARAHESVVRVPVRRVRRVRVPARRQNHDEAQQREAPGGGRAGGAAEVRALRLGLPHGRAVLDRAGARSNLGREHQEAGGDEQSGLPGVRQDPRVADDGAGGAARLRSALRHPQHVHDAQSYPSAHGVVPQRGDQRRVPHLAGALRSARHQDGRAGERAVGHLTVLGEGAPGEGSGAQNPGGGDSRERTESDRQLDKGQRRVHQGAARRRDALPQQPERELGAQGARRARAHGRAAPGRRGRGGAAGKSQGRAAAGAQAEEKGVKTIYEERR
mmetsp:Transcript_14750/g.63329  ORF Transcript_14750/g.63329 Transcript_14750/m.63329 type:complete len:398 (-) Transcript_14750:108-1301(-)